MIYFVQGKSDGLIKIGTTTDLTRRLYALRTTAGQEIHVLAVAEGGPKEEAVIHKKFAYINVVSEWFEPHADLLGFIAGFAEPWSGRTSKPICVHLTRGLHKALRCEAAELGISMTALARRIIAHDLGFSDDGTNR